MSLKSKISTAYKVWRTGGIAGVRRRLSWNTFLSSQHNAYLRWLANREDLAANNENAIVRQLEEFNRYPLISVVVPVYDVDERWLRFCIESVLRQVYPHWELCIADDCSKLPHIRRVLEEYSRADKRIKLVFRSENGHISAASNSALDLASGEFVVLLDHDDELSADALFYVAREVIDHPDAMMIYSDEDMIDSNGRRFQPNFKPDFSYDLLLSVNLVTHLSAYKTELLRSIGGFRIGLEGSQDYDLALRAVEQISEKQIRHIPRVLYHWRVIEGSVALSGDQKPYAHERARIAIRDHLKRSGIEADVSATPQNFHRVRYRQPDEAPRVSIIVDSDNATGDLACLISKTDYPQLEIVAVSRNRSVLDTDVDPRITIAVCSDPRRAYRLNFGALQSTADIYVFVGTGLVPRSEDWIEELVGFAFRGEIGVVGGRVSTPDETVVDGGLIVGTSKGVNPAHAGFPKDVAGMTARNVVIANYSAVSESCLAVKKRDFDMVEGFDDQNFPSALFAADLCMKVSARGLRVLTTPFAELERCHHREIEYPSEAELLSFTERWPQQSAADPFYNPNLSKSDGTFSIDA